MFKNGKDPYTGLDIVQILALDERDYKHWNVHSLVVLKQEVRDIKKRPERVRANVALIGSIIASVCAMGALVISVITWLN